MHFFLQNSVYIIFQVNEKIDELPERNVLYENKIKLEKEKSIKKFDLHTNKWLNLQTMLVVSCMDRTLNLVQLQTNQAKTKEEWLENQDLLNNHELQMIKIDQLVIYNSEMEAQKDLQNLMLIFEKTRILQLAASSANSGQTFEDLVVYTRQCINNLPSKLEVFDDINRSAETNLNQFNELLHNNTEKRNELERKLIELKTEETNLRYEM